VIAVRRAAERFRTQIDWLDSRHTFSFGEHYDAAHMGFRALRVINEDRVRPASGFGTHPHRDMEIVSWVIEGALEHRDSLGNGSVIRPGDAQRMSAGTGIRHSEWNHSKTEPVHFLQIWIVPERGGLAPGYEQKAIDVGSGGFGLLASRDGREGSVTIHQDADVLAFRLAPGAEASRALARGRGAWVQVVRGSVRVGDTALAAGDGASIEEEANVTIRADEAAEGLVFDLGR
jgi:redox-sensitive bicupin YhaK (pirin superfamily)